MACNASSCQSGGCFKDEHERNSPANPPATRVSEAVSVCIKCKSNEVISGSATGGDEARFCYECYRGNVYGKFRLSVTSNDMISPFDKVLVAFSGGTSSRVALQFVHEMQQKALANYKASPDRSLPVFGVGVCFVDESFASQFDSDQCEKTIKSMRSIVSNLDPPRKEFHIVPIESVYSLKACDGRARLKGLADAVTDVTGQEDMLLHLRKLSLQKVAIEKGYSKVLLGSCTSRIASHVITATVKGQGYSLSADIQHVDSRWEVPMVLPLRDCLAQELLTVCRIDGLETLEVLKRPSSGINSLVSSFVKLLQKDNPSRESTIMRTGGKLIPFHFNRIPESLDGELNLASQRRRKKFNITSNDSISSESFCPICYSPLKKVEKPMLRDTADHQSSADLFGSLCCLSCQFQILPDDPASMNHFYSLLPQSMITRAKDSDDKQSWLRKQIEDCLLSDNEDET